MELTNKKIGLVTHNNRVYMGYVLDSSNEEKDPVHVIDENAKKIWISKYIVAKMKILKHTSYSYPTKIIQEGVSIWQ